MAGFSLGESVDPEAEFFVEVVIQWFSMFLPDSLARGWRQSKHPFRAKPGKCGR